MSAIVLPSTTFYNKYVAGLRNQRHEDSKPRVFQFAMMITFPSDVHESVLPNDYAEWVDKFSYPTGNITLWTHNDQPFKVEIFQLGQYYALRTGWSDLMRHFGFQESCYFFFSLNDDNSFNIIGYCETTYNYMTCFFEIFMQDKHIINKELEIPNDFVDRNMPRLCSEQSFIITAVDKQWSVSLDMYASGIFMTKGWGKMKSDLGLNVGHLLLFHMVDKNCLSLSVFENDSEKKNESPGYDIKDEDVDAVLDYGTSKTLGKTIPVIFTNDLGLQWNLKKMQESQMSLQDLQNNTDSFDPTVTHDDFLDQMLSGLQTTVSWSDVSAGDGEPGQNKPTLPWDVDHFDDQLAILSSKLRQQQITGGRTPSSALKALELLRGLASTGESSLFPNDNIDDSSFKSPIGDNNSIQNLFHGFTGSLTSNQTQQLRNLPAQTFGSPGAAAAVMSQVQATTGGRAAPSQPRQRVRAKRGQATDPHSIAERLRRERIAERMKALQELVPNVNKTDRASMLDEIIDYVKFLRLQFKVLSMSRLGGAGASVGATIGAEGGGDCGQGCGDGGGRVERSSNGTTSSLDNDTITVTENQVVKLMEEDMGSAMRYLQGKGLCLMPISLATAISTATCHPSSSQSNHPLGGAGGGEVGEPSSPNMPVLTVQSANAVSVKESP